MKLSVSLPEEDVEFLDGYASTHGVRSRSAALQQAIALLRAHALADSYEQAWSEWNAGPDAPLWEAVAADGLEGS